MYMHSQICIYILIYTHTHIYTYIYIYVYSHTHIYIYIYIYIGDNSRGFSIGNDIDIASIESKPIDMSSMSLRCAMTEKLLSLIKKRDVNLKHNFLEGELSHAAIRYICSSRMKGYNIDISNNNGFTLPKDIGKLGGEIHMLDLSKCSLKGSIPHSIDMFPQGTYINFSDNRLSGMLPTGLVRLASVMYSSNIFDSLAGLCNSFNPYDNDKKISLENNDGFVLPGTNSFLA